MHYYFNSTYMIQILLWSWTLNWNIDNQQTFYTDSDRNNTCRSTEVRIQNCIFCYHSEFLHSSDLEWSLQEPKRSSFYTLRDSTCQLSIQTLETDRTSSVGCPFKCLVVCSSLVPWCSSIGKILHNPFLDTFLHVGICKFIKLN